MHELSCVTYTPLVSSPTTPRHYYMAHMPMDAALDLKPQSFIHCCWICTSLFDGANRFDWTSIYELYVINNNGHCIAAWSYDDPIPTDGGFTLCRWNLPIAFFVRNLVRSPTDGRFKLCRWNLRNTQQQKRMQHASVTLAIGDVKKTASWCAECLAASLKNWTHKEVRWCLPC